MSNQWPWDNSHNTQGASYNPNQSVNSYTGNNAPYHTPYDSQPTQYNPPIYNAQEGTSYPSYVSSNQNPLHYPVNMQTSYPVNSQSPSCAYPSQTPSSTTTLSQQDASLVLKAVSTLNNTLGGLELDTECTNLLNALSKQLGSENSSLGVPQNQASTTTEVYSPTRSLSPSPEREGFSVSKINSAKPFYEQYNAYETETEVSKKVDQFHQTNRSPSRGRTWAGSASPESPRSDRGRSSRKRNRSQESSRSRHGESRSSKSNDSSAVRKVIEILSLSKRENRDLVRDQKPSNVVLVMNLDPWITDKVLWGAIHSYARKEKTTPPFYIEKQIFDFMPNVSSHLALIAFCTVKDAETCLNDLEYELLVTGKKHKQYKMMYFREDSDVFPVLIPKFSGIWRAVTLRRKEERLKSGDHKQTARERYNHIPPNRREKRSPSRDLRPSRMEKRHQSPVRSSSPRNDNSLSKDEKNSTNPEMKPTVENEGEVEEKPVVKKSKPPVPANVNIIKTNVLIGKMKSYLIKQHKAKIEVEEKETKQATCSNVTESVLKVETKESIKDIQTKNKEKIAISLNKSKMWGKEKETVVDKNSSAEIFSDKAKELSKSVDIAQDKDKSNFSVPTEHIDEKKNNFKSKEKDFKKEKSESATLGHDESKTVKSECGMPGEEEFKTIKSEAVTQDKEAKQENGENTNLKISSSVTKPSVSTGTKTESKESSKEQKVVSKESSEVPEHKIKKEKISKVLTNVPQERDLKPKPIDKAHLPLPPTKEKTKSKSSESAEVSVSKRKMSPEIDDEEQFREDIAELYGKRSRVRDDYNRDQFQRDSWRDRRSRDRSHDRFDRSRYSDRKMSHHSYSERFTGSRHRESSSDRYSRLDYPTSQPFPGKSREHLSDHDMEDIDELEDIDGAEEDYWYQKKVSEEEKKPINDNEKSLSKNELKDPEFLLRVLLQTSIMIQNNQLTMSDPMESLTQEEKNMIIQTLGELDRMKKDVIQRTLADSTKFNAAEQRVLQDALANVHTFKKTLGVAEEQPEETDEEFKNVYLSDIPGRAKKGHIANHLNKYGIRCDIIEIHPVPEKSEDTTGVLKFRDPEKAKLLVERCRGNLYIFDHYKPAKVSLVNPESSRKWKCSKCSHRNGMEFINCCNCASIQQSLSNLELSSNVTKSLLLFNFSPKTTERDMVQVIRKIAPRVRVKECKVHTESSSKWSTNFTLELDSYQSGAKIKNILIDHLSVSSNERKSKMSIHYLDLSQKNKRVVQNNQPKKYTLVDVPRLASYSAALYASNEMERVKYFEHYTNLYTQQLVQGEQINVILPDDNTPNTNTSSRLPTGTDNKYWPPPNVSTFVYDPNYGYYYDHSTGLYYEQSSKYFYNMETGKFLTYDVARQTYVLIESNTEIVSAPVKAQPIAPQAIEPVTMKASEEETTVEDQSVRPGTAPKESKLHAKKVMKDMEKWAKSVKKQNKKNINQAMGSGNNPDERSIPADICFDLLQRRDSVRESVSSATNVPQMSSLILQNAVCEEQEEEDGFIDWKSFTCNLCHRAFSGHEVLLKHSKMSDLHKNNLNQWYLSKNLDPHSEERRKQQYRDRAMERRQKVKQSDVKTNDQPESWLCSTPGCMAYKSPNFDTCYSCDMYGAPKPLVSSQISQNEAPASGLENSVGSQLLKKMGWEKGTGLGKRRQGNVNPIEADGKRDLLGLGAQRNAQRLEGESYKDFIKRNTAKRYQETS